MCAPLPLNRCSQSTGTIRHPEFSYDNTTEDIVLAPAIKAQAAALNNNPVQIYNWVRNNVEYLPTYGSIQGAHMTLQTKRGNSFDTASLLIGLLSAANIPTRCVYVLFDLLKTLLNCEKRSSCWYTYYLSDF